MKHIFFQCFERLKHASQLTWGSCSWSHCGLSLGMVMFLLASQTANTKAESVINRILQPSVSTRWVLEGGSIPWVLPKTTSLHSVCVLSCWPPQGPYTPPYHRRNKPSCQHPPTLYSGQSLHGSKERGKVKPMAAGTVTSTNAAKTTLILSTTDKGESWTPVKQWIIPVNFICPASSSKMLKDKNMFSELSTKKKIKEIQQVVKDPL